MVGPIHPVDWSRQRLIRPLSGLGGPFPALLAEVLGSVSIKLLVREDGQI